MFVRADKLALTLKNDGKRSFSYETKASMPFILIGKWVYGAQSWKKGDYYVKPFVSKLTNRL